MVKEASCLFCTSNLSAVSKNKLRKHASPKIEPVAILVSRKKSARKAHCYTGEGVGKAKRPRPLVGAFALIFWFFCIKAKEQRLKLGLFAKGIRLTALC
jgi:hypothetical protein